MTARVALQIVLDPALDEPLHGQIAGQIRQAILQRRLAAGAALPSSRMMAAELDCARGTVLAATDRLVAEGFLTPRAGSGLTVARDLPDEMLTAPPARRGAAMAAACPALPAQTRALLEAPAPPGPGVFALGQPDREAFPFRLWAKLLEQEWRRPDWAVAGLSHPFGHPGLRRAIAVHLGEARGIGCSAAEIVVTSGVRQSVALFAQLVLAPGEAAWMEEPGYPGTRRALAAARMRPVPVPIDAAGFSVEAALAVAPRARLAVVAPAHQFPLGTVLSLQRRLALLSWAERQAGWIIEDDFDGEYRYAGRPLAPLRALDRAGRVAYLGSFSKLLFPALRLSYMVLPAALAGVAVRVMETLSQPAPLLGQGALARFIAEGHLTTHLRRTRLLYAGRQAAVVAAMRRHLADLLTVEPDPGGMQLVARPVAPGFDDTRLAGPLALSACYALADKAAGVLVGYAGTPDAQIDPAVLQLRAALIAGKGC